VYAASDAVALTSANEGTPVTVIEAQAAGKPVVSTDVGGVRDVVADGETGFVVPPHDLRLFTARLAELAGSAELRRRLGDEGRGRALSRYSVPRLFADVDGLYRELLEQADAASPGRRGRPAPAPLPSTRGGARVGKATRSLRILLFSQYFPPEVGATQTRMQTFAEYLAERGHRVTVVAEFPNHPQGVIPPEYRGRIVEVDRSNAYRVIRVWVNASPDKTQLTRLSFYLSFMGLATAVAPAAGRADVVLATTPPLFTAVAGLAVARLNRAPFVLDVRDLWPAAATSLMQISPGWQSTVAEAIERRLYRSAAAVVAVTAPFCRHIDRIRGAEPKTALIPNGTLPQFFVDGDHDPAHRLGVPRGRFLVTFAGILGIAQALPAVVEAAARLNGDAEIALVGDGPMKQIVAELVREQGLHNVTLHPQVPLEEIPPILAASDALLVPLSAHPTFEQFVPSKMVDFMATGRPVILSAAGESARLLEQAGGGVVVPPESPDELAAAVRWLAAHPGEAAEMGRRGREYAGTQLRSAQAERLERLLLDVVPR
jgi:glycosyltransferase involved in cell wall biosynthesis